MFCHDLANMVLFSCSEHEDALVLPDVQIEVSESEIRFGARGAVL